MIEAITNYKTGVELRQQIVVRLEIDVATLSTWIKEYDAYGPTFFDNAPLNNKYSANFKKAAVEHYKEHGSLQQTALHFGIRGKSLLSQWVRRYNNNQGLKDYDPKPEVYTMKTRKTTFLDRIEIVNWTIENNNNYKLAAEKFNTSYSQVFNWVKKYKQLGEEGLKDKRGINKTFDDLTEIEKLKRENEQLKREKEILELEVAVAKKLKELERRRASPGLNTSKYIRKSNK